MNNLSAQLQHSKSLLVITDLVRNRSAFLTLFLTLIGCSLIFVLFGALGASMMNEVGAIFGFLGFLISFLLFITGFSATGFLLTDLIQNRKQRTIREAFLAGLVTLPRLFGLQLMIVGLSVLALLAMVILLLFAKIPGVGPLIFFLVYPICILISAITMFGFFYIAILSGPAIWNGNSAFRSISLLAAILRNRLFAVILQQFLLGLIVFLTLSVLFAVISSATAFTSLLSVPILNMDGGNFASTAFSIFDGGGFGGTNGYMIAAGFDLALLGAAAITLPALMFTAGNCLIFQNVTNGLDTTEIENSLASGLKKIKEQTDAAKDRLNEVKAAIPQQSASAVPAMDIPGQGPNVATNCPACGDAAAAEDAFCGACGHKLK